MSYILDALNKSEEEAKSNRTPDIATVHRRTAPAGKSVPWPLITLMVVLINIGVIAWFVTREDSIGSAPTVAQPAPLVPAQLPEPAQTVVPAPVVPAPIVTAKTTNLDPVRIAELPASVQRQIPDMTFSSHLFSSDSDLRMVSINGSMAREGDTIASGLRLVEITEEGVVLTYLHYKFEMSVLRDWSFE